MGSFFIEAMLTSAIQLGSQLDPASHATVEVTYAGIFYEGRAIGQPPIRVDLSDAMKTAIPVRPQVFGMVEIRCLGVSPEGELNGCEVEIVEPEDAYATAAKAIIPGLSVEPNYARTVTRPVRFIEIQLRLSNSDVPVRRGPCWPPGCSFIPVAPSSVTP